MYQYFMWLHLSRCITILVVWWWVEVVSPHHDLAGRPHVWVISIPTTGLHIFFYHIWAVAARPLLVDDYLDIYIYIYIYIQYTDIYYVYYIWRLYEKLCVLPDIYYIYRALSQYIRGNPLNQSVFNRADRGCWTLLIYSRLFHCKFPLVSKVFFLS